MGKLYRTAQGRTIDIEAIKLQNEMVPAIGNMRVNARGDQLGPGGKIIKTREMLMDEHYQSNITHQDSGPAQDGPIPVRSQRRANQSVPVSSKESFVPADIKADTVEESKTEESVTGGLEKAITKAKRKTKKS